MRQVRGIDKIIVAETNKISKQSVEKKLDWSWKAQSFRKRQGRQHSKASFSNPEVCRNNKIRCRID